MLFSNQECITNPDNFRSNRTEVMEPPHFCNVDLDIESKFDLSDLRTALGRKIFVLTGPPANPGCFLLRLETVPQFNNPDDTICAFCSLLERLPPKAKRAWRSAHKKEFDIGHDIAQSQIASQFSLRSETLRRVASLGATLGITFYNHSEDQHNAMAKTVPTKRRKR